MGLRQQNTDKFYSADCWAEHQIREGPLTALVLTKQPYNVQPNVACVFICNTALAARKTLLS